MNILELLKKISKPVINAYIGWKRKGTLPPNGYDPNAKEDERIAVYEEVFGAVEQDFRGKASRDWRKHEIIAEYQSYGDCVSFSRNNCAEKKAKSEGVTLPDGSEINFSDLDLAVGSGTTQNGNNFDTVGNYAKNVGVRLEKDCPYTRDWNQRIVIFNQNKEAPRYKLGPYSKINNPNDTNVLKAAMEFSPLWIGVGLGSTYGGEDPIKPVSQYGSYHAMTLEYIDEYDQKHCFDHYLRLHRVFSADYPILFARSLRDLPQNWRSINVDGEKLYKRLLGKIILRAETKDGEAYEVFDGYMQKVIFQISSKKLWDSVNACLRKNVSFIGISEKDFAILENYLQTVGGEIKEINDPSFGLRDIQQ